jgi:hypothetical protein
MSLLWVDAQFRLAFIGALWVHELAHVVVAAVCGGGTLLGVWSWSNLRGENSCFALFSALECGKPAPTSALYCSHLECAAAPALAAPNPVPSSLSSAGNVNLANWAQLATPLSPIPRDFQPHVKFVQADRLTSPGSKLLHSAIEVAGVLTSLLLALICSWQGSMPVAVAAWCVLALAIQSDLWERLAGAAAKVKVGAIACNHGGSTVGNSWADSVWVFCCGNFGLLLAEGQGVHGLDCGKILEAMAKICQMRGAQSGGVGSLITPATSGEGPSATGRFRVRVSASKRDDLAVNLSRAMARKSMLRFGAPNPNNMSMGLFVGHTRFATSSMPDANETHPHQWTPPESRRTDFWRAVSAGTLVATWPCNACQCSCLL